MSNLHRLACQEAIEILSNPEPRYRMQHVENLERLRQLWAIDSSAYLDCSLGLDEFEKWWRNYEFGSRLLLDDGDRICASIGLYPLSESDFNAFVAGQIRESSLVPRSVQSCEDEPAQYWYASGIIVAEDARGWGSPLLPLLSRGLKCWMDSGHLKFPLQLAAIAEFPVGARLLEFFDFKKAKDRSEMPDGCDLYQIEFPSRKELATLLKTRLGNGRSRIF